jgi:cellulose biosynthesis protein BcsQ|uniref:ParA family protein n=1 Tax=Caldilinea aerophila TaxID=133453 RepID=A0A7C1FTU8_9CHLR
MQTLAFLNNKGGVGKTTLVYHLAWMFAERGVPTLAVDLDPQSNLTAMFLEEERLEELWPDSRHPNTIYGALQPLIEGAGDIAPPHVEPITDLLGLLVGDLTLSLAEDEFSSQWPDCLDRKPRAFRVLSSLWRVIEQAVEQRDAQIVLIDVGPNLGALNRAAMLCAHHVILPLAPDLFSLQGLKNLGPTLRRWRREWQDRKERRPESVDFSIPPGDMRPAGYVVMQHAMRLDRPVRAYERWMERIPQVYYAEVLGEGTPPPAPDPQRLALLKHYRSLMPMAQEARKPMFLLRPGDGAIGAHVEAVRSCYEDFLNLARKVGAIANVQVP